jgi:hypothetical protein
MSYRRNTSLTGQYLGLKLTYNPWNKKKPTADHIKRRKKGNENATVKSPISRTITGDYNEAQSLNPVSHLTSPDSHSAIILTPSVPLKYPLWLSLYCLNELWQPGLPSVTPNKCGKFLPSITIRMGWRVDQKMVGWIKQLMKWNIQNCCRNSSDRTIRLSC